MAYFDLYVQTDQLKETLELAKNLGWNGLGLIIPWTSEADLNSFRKSVQKLKGLDISVGVELRAKKASKLRDMARNLRKKVELILVSGGDPEINRAALNTPEVDVLNHPWGVFSDLRSDPGFDYVGAKLGTKNKVAIQFSFGELLHYNKRSRVQLLANMEKAAVLVRKFKTPFVITSGAKEPFDLRGPRDLLSFGRILGFQDPDIKKSMSDSIVQENRKRLGKKWVMPGVEIE
jgi:ribonuclease P/MRP protein subunit RPP1